MVKTFKQFVEMITHQQSDGKLLINILKKLDHETIVRFALVCAEDAYEVNPTPEAKKCIDLVKQWLSSDENERENLKPQLKTAAADAYAADAYVAGVSAAGVSAAYAAAWSVVYAAASAAASAAYEASRVTSSYDEYIQLAKSLLSKTTINTKGTNQELTVLLDFLEDHGEDLIIRNNQGTFLNFPEKHFKLSDKSLNNFEVAELIMKNRRLMFYINNMYK